MDYFCRFSVAAWARGTHRCPACEKLDLRGDRATDDPGAPAGRLDWSPAAGSERPMIHRRPHTGPVHLAETRVHLGQVAIADRPLHHPIW